MNRRTLVLAALALPLLSRVGKAMADRMTVYRSPTCGCCGVWIDHVQAAGFDVTMIEVDQDELLRRKLELGVPEALASCHTATIGGYAIEGHVPAGDIARLLAERPEGRGLAVPGMPAGSPGMETGGQTDAYDVVLFGAGGAARIFASHG